MFLWVAKYFPLGTRGSGSQIYVSLKNNGIFVFEAKTIN